MKMVGYSDGDKEIRTIESDTYAFALDLNTKSGDKKIILLVQGSYANKTNITSQSDVDVAVILESTFMPEYRANVTGENYGFTKGTYTATELKDEVERALNIKFNYDGIERHDKSIRVYGNTYRVDADVVPAYRFRDYTNDFRFDANNYVAGIEIRPDSGGRIINYPEQHIKNGIEKNLKTNYQFKRCVRVMKNIREDMNDNGFRISDQISSFGLESLLWNIPDGIFTKYSSMKYIFEELVDYLYKNMGSFSMYYEANGIKKLFSKSEIQIAYTNFVKDLKDFYAYE